MSVGNFRKEDLVGKSLERLLTEVENLSRDGSEASYKKLEKFIIELAAITQTSIKVSKEDGSKSMDIRGEQVDLVSVLGEITDIIRTGIDGNAVYSKKEIDARKVLRETISSTVSVLLKEDEIVQELAGRGITDAEFEKYAQEEIAKSQRKVQELEKYVKDKKSAIKLMDAVEEGTVELSRGKFLSKSKADELRHDKRAIELLEKVEEKLTELAKLQSAANKLDKSSPDYATDYAANETVMQTLLTDVKGLTSSLKALGLRTSPVAEKAGVKKSDIDFDYLDKLDLTSNFTLAKTKTVEIRSKDGTNKSLETLIKEEHRILYDAKKAIMKKDFAKFGFSSAAEVDALDDAAIDKKLEELKHEVQKIQDVIDFEKEYQAQTADSIKKFKDQISKEQALGGKLTKVTKRVQVPKMKPDGTPELDADGKPVVEVRFVEDYEPTADTRKAYLDAAGVKDEDKYRSDAVQTAEDEELRKVDKLSIEEKRELIQKEYRKDGRWHPIKWLKSLFMTDRMWAAEGYKNKYLKAIEPTITAAKTAAEDKARKELDAKIAPALSKDKEELQKVSTEVAYVRSSAKEAITSAVSQEKITDELYRGTDVDRIKEGSKAAAVMTALGTVSDFEMAIAEFKKKNGKITDAEFQKIEAAYNAKKAVLGKLSETDIQDRAHADNLSKQNRDRTAKTPTFEDRE